MITAGVCLNHERAIGLRLPELRYDGLQDLKQRLAADPLRFISGDLEDFRRAGNPVRLAQLGAILAASDQPSWSPQQTALISWNGGGGVRANQTYWDDYRRHGRETGRGTFFVPTLPSIPACEAAITLDIHGPVCHLQTAPHTRLLLEHISDLLHAEPLLRQIMLAEIHEDQACLLLCDRHPSPLPDCPDLSTLFRQCQTETMP